jgi:hypothetical protein
MTKKRWAEHSSTQSCQLLRSWFFCSLHNEMQEGHCIYTPSTGTWGSLDGLLGQMRKEAEKWRAGLVTSVVLPAQLLLLAPLRLRCWRFIGLILKSNEQRAASVTSVLLPAPFSVWLHAALTLRCWRGTSCCLLLWWALDWWWWKRFGSWGVMWVLDQRRVWGDPAC